MHKELFLARNSTYELRGSQNLSAPRVNQTIYGLKSIRYQGPKIWNSPPADFHKASSLDEFKNLIKKLGMVPLATAISVNIGIIKSRAQRDKYYSL